MKATGFLVLLCGAALGCGSGRNMQSAAEPGPDGSAVTVKGSDLSGNMLEALRARVPSMMVSTQTGGCPAIIFRGVRSVRNQGNPSVYIDGTMMVDTCILQQISTNDVDRVEVYPSGLASKPGIQRNPFGVIIVYRIKE